MTSPTLLTSLQQAASAAGSAASATATPMSTIRLTMPQQTRQRSPAAVGTAVTPQMSAQVLKVMGSQPGSIPQIITLSSPRAVLTHLVALWSINRAAGDAPYISLKKQIAGTDTVTRS